MAKAMYTLNPPCPEELQGALVNDLEENDGEPLLT